uniref:Uncharacterized protein n=1 Tax=Plectus sambesii TaxID=2011161 RepID=A0A914VQ14_9BILA
MDPASNLPPPDGPGAGNFGGAVGDDGVHPERDFIYVSDKPDQREKGDPAARQEDPNARKDRDPAKEFDQGEHRKHNEDEG